jgi:hypothetical protein
MEVSKIEVPFKWKGFTPLNGGFRITGITMDNWDSNEGFSKSI